MPVFSVFGARGWRHAAAGLALLMALTLVAPASVQAHGAPGAAVKARPDALPERLSDIRAQVHMTVTSQLVVENRGEDVLEVLDDNGRAFVRIGPDGVEVDTHAHAYYRVRAPTTGERLPERLQQADGPLAPRWQKVREAPSWGWFDARVDVDRIEVPDEVREAGESRRLAEWQIPVRYGGERTSIAGGFFFEPLQTGRFVARISGESEVLPDVRFGVAPGPIPSLYVHNESDSPLVILDGQERPWYRIGDGIAINVEREQGATSWVRIGGGNRHSWTEPRAAYPDRKPPHDVMHDAEDGAKLADWAVPFLIDGERHQLQGEVRWYPGEEGEEAFKAGSHH